MAKIECRKYEYIGKHNNNTPQEIILRLEDINLLESYSDKYGLFGNVGFLSPQPKTNHCRVDLPEDVPDEDILLLFPKEHLTEIEGYEIPFDRIIPYSVFKEVGFTVGVN